jgi:hypothetical protein
MTTKLNIRGEKPDNGKAQNVASTIQYPFDAYYVATRFGARNPATNETIPIVYANLLGNIQGWSSSSEVRRRDPRIGCASHGRPQDAIAMFASPSFIYPNGRILEIHLERADAIKVFTIMVLIVMSVRFALRLQPQR